jgi:hypothetical protein
VQWDIHARMYAPGHNEGQWCAAALTKIVPRFGRCAADEV